jgi:GMP synthase (glutamine-hydrolysing)
LQHELILILDFGSQYTQLIARRVRELGVYCEIVPFHLSLEKILERAPKGVILSGGPSSVYDEDAPNVADDFFDKIKVPILGICYGMGLIATAMGAESKPAERREYGHAKLQVLNGDSNIFCNLEKELDVWMSHGDHVTSLPKGFHTTATTGPVDGAIITAIENAEANLYAVQFHPEVSHTPRGKEISFSASADAKAIGRRRVLSRKRSIRSKRSWAKPASWFAGFRAGSILPWPPRWCTKL